MKIGFIGLGKMGLSMAGLLKKKGHSVVAYDASIEAIKMAKEKKILTVGSLSDLVNKLDSPKIIWIMVPSQVTEEVIETLTPLLKKNDILIDGGNSYYKDSVNRSRQLKKHGIDFIDIGTSGGILGAESGYCLMVGGKKSTCKFLEPIFKDLSFKDGYQHVGISGSGHFVKMIHNGIEYAILQAYGEGFDLMFLKKEFDLDLEKISKLWNKGSIIRSFILELSEKVFEKYPSLKNIEGFIEDSGEGRWTVQESLDLKTPIPAISASVMHRFYSRNKDLFSSRLIAALRNAFGGHYMKKSGEK